MFSPTKDPSFSRGYYIPRDLEDALHELDRSLSWTMKRKLRAVSERELAGATHMDLGLFIRNYWLRAKPSRLRASLDAIGIRSLDDMSAVIITSFHRRSNKRAIDLKQQIADHDAFWNASKPPTPYICEETESPVQIEHSVYSASEPTRVVYVGICPDESKVYFEHGRGWSSSNPMP